MIKLVAFDLDGTLTQHKTKLGDKNRSVLDRLGEKYKLLMVGAGQCMRIFNQMDGYPIDIIGNYGLQYAKYNSETKRYVKLHNDLIECTEGSALKNDIPSEESKAAAPHEVMSAIIGIQNFGAFFSDVFERERIRICCILCLR